MSFFVELAVEFGFVFCAALTDAAVMTFTTTDFWEIVGFEARVACCLAREEAVGDVKEVRLRVSSSLFDLGEPTDFSRDVSDLMT